MLIVLLPKPALAYIGPGAGFALAGSFFAIFGAIFSALSMVLLWPIRRLLRMLFRRKPPGKIRFRRVVILGLDGLDHGLTEKLLAAGKLPNLARLRQQGGVSIARQHIAADFAGGLVLVSNGRQSRQAQHLRLPDSRPTHL